jgi:hypothetical protein
MKEYVMKKTVISFVLALTANFVPMSAIANAPANVKTHIKKIAIAITPPKPKRKVEENPVDIANHASRSRGYNNSEWGCLFRLWNRESHFNPKARNKHSGAYGIPQFMPQTWKNYKSTKTSDPRIQIKLGLRYIEKRYGSACNAWKHSRKHGWY